jgi:tetratricopeptide (TPR) repeat protein
MIASREDVDPPLTGKLGVLAGWKGIAGYFGCNVRTVRRYERERGLPVHRAPGKKGSTVFAYTSELDAWLDSREEQQGLEPVTTAPGTSRDQSNGAPGNARSTGAAELRTTTGGRPATHVLFLRRYPWVFASFVVLMCSASLFWMVQRDRTASAIAAAKPGRPAVNSHVPPSGAESLFLRGRYYWNLRTRESLARAIDAYTQAIVLDPAYADAYAGLAEAYDLLPQFGQADLGDSLAKAEQAADRAIALNPNLAAAHQARAFAMFYWDWDVNASDTEFRRALALDPDSADAHQWYASTLQCRGEGAEAIRQIDEAVQLRPTSAAIAADAAYFHADFGNFDAGVRALKEIERTQPDLSTPAWFLRELDFATGDYPDYIVEARRYASITHDPGDAELAAAVALGWARAGKAGLLEARARVLKIAFDRGTDAGFQLGETLLLMGSSQKALPYFEASLDRRINLLMTMRDCPWAEGLARDPGYAALFAQIDQRLHRATPPHLQSVPVSRRLPM